MSNPIKIGEQAPEISLKDQNNKVFKLSDHKGKRILLSFHPLAWTPVCANQMKSLEANKDTFEKLNTVAIGLSIDSLFSKQAWAKELQIQVTPLLADFWPHGGAAKSLGVFREKEGFSERVNIILDENHKVAFVKVYDIPQLPDINEIIDVLKAMK